MKESEIDEQLEIPEQESCNVFARLIQEYCTAKNNNTKKNNIADFIKQQISETSSSDLSHSDHAVELVNSLLLAVETQSKDSNLITDVIPCIIKKYPNILNIVDGNNNTILKASLNKKLYGFIHSCLNIAKEEQKREHSYIIDLKSNGYIEMIEQFIKEAASSNNLSKKKDLSKAHKLLLELCASSKLIDRAELKTVETLCQEYILKMLKERETLYRTDQNTQKLEWLIDTMKKLSLTWNDADEATKSDIVNTIIDFNNNKTIHAEISSKLIKNVGITKPVSLIYYNKLVSELEIRKNMVYESDLQSGKKRIEKILYSIEILLLRKEISGYIAPDVVDKLENIVDERYSPIIKALKNYKPLSGTVEEKLALQHIKHPLETEESSYNKRLKTDENSSVTVNDSKSEDLQELAEAKLLLGLSADHPMEL